LSILISLWIYISANPVNRYSDILALNQVLIDRKEEKLLSAIATEMGSVTNILIKDGRQGKDGRRR